MAKQKPSRRRQSEDYDDDASEPNSEELNVSSPEVLVMDDEGEVVMNSDWTKAEKKKQKEQKRLQREGVDGTADAGLIEERGDAQNDREKDIQESEAEDWESEEDESEVDLDEAGEEDDERRLTSVSFGTLAKAQDLASPGSNKRKRDSNNDEAEEKLAALRQRLKELQNGKSWKQHRQLDQDEEAASEQDSGSSESEQHEASKGRSSKHAPMVLSSKRQVTRKRPVVDVPKTNARDPRFNATSFVDREKIRKDYAFLDGYVDSEIKDIKATLKTQKVPQRGSKKKKVKGAPKLTEEEVDALKRELVQKESKRAAQTARDRHADVLKEHKKHERQLVKTGKKAYFLKNSEVKQKVLTKQFEGMGEGKREKLMEKKRKRVASKERRFMPETRRGV